MSIAPPNRRFSPLLGHALLLACSTAALWLATAVVVPTAQVVMKPYGTQVPAFFAPAFPISDASYQLVVPITVLGGVSLVVALLGRGPARLIAVSRRALALLAGIVACLALYLLSSAGVAFKFASFDQRREMKIYTQALEQFALLEAAQGRYAEFHETFLKTRGLKMVEVRGAADFNNTEARERISLLIDSLPKATDTAMKRRILATLCLFRERIRPDEYEARGLLPHATEAGAPFTNSHIETLQWIAVHLNQDGWEPLPLFKFSR
jgi:hypothetical protein